MGFRGNKMLELRGKRALTQVQLAAALGVTVATIANWENGRRQPPLHTLDRLAKELGVKPSRLID